MPELLLPAPEVPLLPEPLPLEEPLLLPEPLLEEPLLLPLPEDELVLGVAAGAAELPDEPESLVEDGPGVELPESPPLGVADDELFELPPRLSVL